MKFTKNYTQKNPAVTYQQATQDIASGKAAILPLGTYAIPQIRLINKDANLRFAQMPATVGDQGTAADRRRRRDADDRRAYEALHRGSRIRRLPDERGERAGLLKQQSAFTPYKDTYVGDEALNGVLDFYKAGKLADFCDHYVPASINLAGFLRRWCSRAILNDS